MVDCTTYDPAFVPELALRQIFGRQRLPPDLCRLIADRRLLTIEAFAMLGDTIGDVKAAVKVIIGDETLLGATAGDREIALTSIAAEDLLDHARPLRRSASKDGRRSDQST